MRWPEIFFKSRKAEVRSPFEIGTKPKTPAVLETDKKPDAPPAPVADDKTTTESLRALNQKDTMQIAAAPVLGESAHAAKPGALGADGTAERPRDAASSEASSPTATSFRRKAKLTDFARVLQPKPPVEQETPPPVVSESAAVVPAAFPVVGTAGNVMDAKLGKDDEPASSAEFTPPDSSGGPVVSEKPDAPAEAGKKADDFAPEEAKASTSDASSGASLKDTTRVTLPERVIALPQDRPSPTTLDTVKPDSDPREKREFILANGERIFGHVLSETVDTIYLEHQTLGVLTLPRLQIAGKPIEVILINGDRIVGDLIAETTECLYIRHASLGMVTVPHSQRSTRVVEAILKDGDRILGEVLAETDDFTVIRSATLGTVAVQHEQVAMLNRKIEQMQLRALPAPALEDTKPDPSSS